MPDDRKLIPVQILALVEEQMTDNPIVLLHDQQGNRVLPIWVGDAEARAIAIALNDVPTPRPLTHNLLLSVLAKLGGTISRVVVDDLRESTYFAKLYVNTKDGAIVVDARPSDAIALALTVKVPVFVTKQIMDVSGQSNPFRGDMMVKKPLSDAELEHLKKLLERARQREEQSGTK